jgi:hypothetical protein
MARTKQTTKPTAPPKYSHLEVELARIGYATWAGIPVESVSPDFICRSSLGVYGWAKRALYHIKRGLERDLSTKRAVDGAFRSVLRETHPDRAGAERSFTANEVAALLNAQRAKFT